MQNPWYRAAAAAALDRSSVLQNILIINISSSLWQLGDCLIVSSAWSDWSADIKYSDLLIAVKNKYETREYLHIFYKSAKMSEVILYFTCSWNIVTDEYLSLCAGGAAVLVSHIRSLDSNYYNYFVLCRHQPTSAMLQPYTWSAVKWLAKWKQETRIRVLVSL